MREEQEGLSKLGWKVNPKSFRQAILREWEKNKNLNKVIEAFEGDKYPKRLTIIFYTLHDREDAYEQLREYWKEKENRN